MKNNVYFEELKRLGNEYNEKCAGHEAKKQAIIDAYGWNSAELDAWYKERGEFKCPFTLGAAKAYIAWRNSLHWNQDELELNDTLFGYEIQDFLDTLRKAGIKTFVYTARGYVFENMLAFEKDGCSVQGLCTIKRKDEEEEYELPGIRFSLN